MVVVELRQLRSAKHHIITHQQRRIDLGIATNLNSIRISFGLSSVRVEHELPERTLHPRQPPLQYYEARAG